MIVPRLRRTLIVLVVGLALACAGVGATVAGMVWGLLAAEWGGAAVFVIIIAGSLGTMWWLDDYRSAKVDDAAPRTIQYVYVRDPVPPPSRQFSTVYVPRSPIEDTRSVEMWVALHDETGEISRR